MESNKVFRVELTLQEWERLSAEVDYRVLEEWLRENTPGFHIWMRRCCFFFNKESDAILFKLTWF